MTIIGTNGQVVEITIGIFDGIAWVFNIFITWLSCYDECVTQSVLLKFNIHVYGKV